MPDPAEPDWEAQTALEVERAAAELGAIAAQASAAFPWVISGLVDERAFYLRERHGAYDVVVAADTAPLESPWVAEARGVTVASGLSDDFTVDGKESPARAVRVAIGAVRAWQRQRACTHDHDTGDRYCRRCGTPLIDPAMP